MRSRISSLDTPARSPSTSEQPLINAADFAVLAGNASAKRACFSCSKFGGVLNPLPRMRTTNSLAVHCSVWRREGSPPTYSSPFSTTSPTPADCHGRESQKGRSASAPHCCCMPLQEDDCSRCGGCSLLPASISIICLRIGKSGSFKGLRDAARKIATETYHWHAGGRKEKEKREERQHNEQNNICIICLGDQQVLRVCEMQLAKPQPDTYHWQYPSEKFCAAIANRTSFWQKAI